nr:MAG TPA: PIN like domain [Caudoviricetes sp.]
MILDTNVFCGSYRLSPDYLEFTLACLTAIKDRIVIPYTVKIAFLKYSVSLYKTRQV